MRGRRFGESPYRPSTTGIGRSTPARLWSTSEARSRTPFAHQRANFAFTSSSQLMANTTSPPEMSAVDIKMKD